MSLVWTAGALAGMRPIEQTPAPAGSVCAALARAPAVQTQ
jgi:hypothetical protein